MRTKTIQLNLITHLRKKHWIFYPTFTKSHIVFDEANHSWIAPIYEFCFLFFVFSWAAYDKKKLYKNTDEPHHDCPAELLQERVNELEKAIRDHADDVGPTHGMAVDRLLWSSLRDY